MTDMTTQERFRQAAEAEGGNFVSAGARMSHLMAAVESGCGLYIDLSSVPVENRAALADEIRAIVKRAGAPGPIPSPAATAPRR